MRAEKRRECVLFDSLLILANVPDFILVFWRHWSVRNQKEESVPQGEAEMTMDADHVIAVEDVSKATCAPEAGL